MIIERGSSSRMGKARQLDSLGQEAVAGNEKVKVALELISRNSPARVNDLRLITAAAVSPIEVGFPHHSSRPASIGVVRALDWHFSFW
jgi:hypothetical protein